MKVGVGALFLCVLAAVAQADAASESDVAAAMQAFRDFRQAILDDRPEDAWDILSESLKQAAGTEEEWTHRARAAQSRSYMEKMMPTGTKVRGDTISVLTSYADPNRLRVDFKREDGAWKLVGVGYEREPAYPSDEAGEFSAAAAVFARMMCRIFDINQICAEAERLEAWAPGSFDGRDIAQVRAALTETHDVALRYGDAFRVAVKSGDLKNAQDELNLLKKQFDESATTLAGKATAFLQMVKRTGTLSQDIAALRRVVPVGNPVGRGRAGAHIQFGFVARFWDYATWESVRPLNFDFACIDVGWGDVQVPLLPDGRRDFAMTDRLVARNATFELKSDIGQAGLGRLSFNHWDPTVVTSHKTYFKDLGDHYRDNPNIVSYEIFNEPDTYEFDRDHPEAEHVRRQYRDYLKRKFRTVDSLNKTCGTTYASFDGVDFPPIEARDDYTPMTYEFARFKQQSMADFLWCCIEGLHRADPNHPVLTQITEFDGIQDAFLIGSGPQDAFSVHMTFGGPHGGDNNMVEAYSLAKVLEKPLWQEEFIFNYPEAADRPGGAETNPATLAAAIERNVWQAAAWGFSGILFFELDNYWSGWNNFVLDRDVRYGLLRPSSGVIPSVLAKIRKVDPVLRGTRIVTPEIAILDCPTTKMLPGRRDTANKVASALERWLSEDYWAYLMVPEGGLDRRFAEIEKYKVILLPATTHLRRDAARILTQWARNGGKIVVIGTRVVKDEYGRESELMHLGHDQADFMDRVETSPGTLVKLFADRGITKRAWFEGAGKVELVVREDRAGKLYLTAINLDSSSDADGTVAVRCACDRVTDLCADVSTRANRESGVLRFPMHLSPGEGTMLAVGAEL